ncbi:MAG: hypothetical protein ACI9MJ_002038 [Alphaproteobacteria bacterium]|jgi:hypothetical protein
MELRVDDGLERERRIKRRNWALFGVLLSLVVLFYVISIVRVGGV